MTLGEEWKELLKGLKMVCEKDHLKGLVSVQLLEIVLGTQSGCAKAELTEQPKESVWAQQLCFETGLTSENWMRVIASQNQVQ
jgi:hypothetical protein